MALSTNKLVAVALTGTGIAGAGAGTYYALSSTPEPKSKIRQLIANSNRTILINNDDNLDIKLDVYKKSIKDLNKITLTNEDKEGIKAWCNEILDTEIEISKKDETNSDFQIALKLCTKATNKEKLEKNSKTIAGEKDWPKIETNYKAKGDLDAKIPTIENKTNATKALIIKWCTENLDKENDDTNYKIAEKWCTKPAD